MNTQYLRNTFVILVILCIPQIAFAATVEETQSRNFIGGLSQLIQGPVFYCLEAIAIVVCVWGLVTQGVRWAFIGLGSAIFIATVKYMALTFWSQNPTTFGLVSMDFPTIGLNASDPNSMYNGNGNGLNSVGARFSGWYGTISMIAVFGCSLCERFITLGFTTGIFAVFGLIGGGIAYYKTTTLGSIKPAISYMTCALLGFALCLLPVVEMKAPNNGDIDFFFNNGTKRASIPLVPALAISGTYHLTNLMVATISRDQDKECDAWIIDAATKANAGGDPPGADQFRQYSAACSRMAYQIAMQAGTESISPSSKFPGYYGTKDSQGNSVGAAIFAGRNNTWNIEVNRAQGITLLNIAYDGEQNIASGQGGTPNLNTSLLNNVPLGSLDTMGNHTYLKAESLFTMEGLREAYTPTTVRYEKWSDKSGYQFVNDTVEGYDAYSLLKYLHIGQFKSWDAIKEWKPVHQNTQHVYDPYLDDFILSEHALDGQMFANAMNTISAADAGNLVYKPGSYAALIEGSERQRIAAQLLNPNATDSSGRPLTNNLQRFKDTRYLVPVCATHDSNGLVFIPTSLDSNGQPIEFQGDPALATTQDDVDGRWTYLSIQPVYSNSMQTIPANGPKTLGRAIFENAFYKSLSIETGNNATNISWTNVDAAASNMDNNIYPVDMGSYVRTKMLIKYLTAMHVQANKGGIMASEVHSNCFASAKRNPGPDAWGCLVVGAYAGNVSFSSTGKKWGDPDIGDLSFYKRVQDRFDAVMSGSQASYANRIGYGVTPRDPQRTRRWYQMTTDIYTMSPAVRGALGIKGIPGAKSGSPDAHSTNSGDESIFEMTFHRIITWLAESAAFIMIFFLELFAQLVVPLFQYLMGGAYMVVLAVFPIYGAMTLTGNWRAIIGPIQALVFIGLWPVGIAMGYFLIDSAGTLKVTEMLSRPDDYMTTPRISTFMTFCGYVIMFSAPMIANALIDLSGRGAMSLASQVPVSGFSVVGGMARGMASILGAAVGAAGMLAGAAVATRAVSQIAESGTNSATKMAAGGATAAAATARAVTEQVQRTTNIATQGVTLATSAVSSSMGAAATAMGDAGQIAQGAGSGLQQGVDMGNRSLHIAGQSSTLRNAGLSMVASDSTKEAMMDGSRRGSDQQRLAKSAATEAQSLGKRAVDAQRSGNDRDAAIFAHQAALADVKASRHYQNIGNVNDAAKHLQSATDHARIAHQHGHITDAEFGSVMQGAVQATREAVSHSIVRGDIPSQRAHAAALTRMHGLEAEHYAVRRQEQMADYAQEGTRLLSSNESTRSLSLDAQSGELTKNVNGMQYSMRQLESDADSRLKSARLSKDDAAIASAEHDVKLLHSEHEKAKELMASDPSYHAKWSRYESTRRQWEQADHNYAASAIDTVKQASNDLSSIARKPALSPSDIILNEQIAGQLATLGSVHSESGESVRGDVAALMNDHNASLRSRLDTTQDPEQRARLAYAADVGAGAFNAARSEFSRSPIVIGSQGTSDEILLADVANATASTSVYQGDTFTQQRVANLRTGISTTKDKSYSPATKVETALGIAGSAGVTQYARPAEMYGAMQSEATIVMSVDSSSMVTGGGIKQPDEAETKASSDIPVLPPAELVTSEQERKTSI